MSSFESVCAEACQVSLDDSGPTPVLEADSVLRDTVHGKVYLFCGPPGCGKGTHCAKIAERLGCIHISTGDLFRAEVSAGTDLGKQIEPIMSSGAFVPPDVVCAILSKRLTQPDTVAGVLLDGYPRNIDHLRDLDKMLQTLPLTLGSAIYLHLTEAEAITRLSGRRVCGSCKATLHVSMLAEKDKCPKCGNGPLNRRADDKEDIILQRYQLATESYEPVVADLARRHCIYMLSGAASMETITNRVIEVMCYPDRFRTGVEAGAVKKKGRCVIC